MTTGNDSTPQPALPPRPTPPRPEDCCGSGCVNCIYAIYDDALLTWEREMEKILADATKPSAPANASAS